MQFLVLRISDHIFLKLLVPLHWLPLRQKYIPFLVPDAVCHLGWPHFVKRMRFLSWKWVPAYGQRLLESTSSEWQISLHCVSHCLALVPSLLSGSWEAVCGGELGRSDGWGCSATGTRQGQHSLSSPWVCDTAPLTVCRVWVWLKGLMVVVWAGWGVYEWIHPHGRAVTSRGFFPCLLGGFNLNEHSAIGADNRWSVLESIGVQHLWVL